MDQIKPIISHEGTSILYEHKIELSEQPPTKNYYIMRDWKTASVSLSCNTDGVSGNVQIQQSLRRTGKPFNSSDGAVVLAATDGEETAIFDVTIGGTYLVLDFSQLTFPTEGTISVVVLGKRN